jgi:hypothetical protein
MSNLKISPAKFLLTTLLVSGGIVVVAIISNYPGVVEIQVSLTGFQFRVNGQDSLKPALKSGNPISPDSEPVYKLPGS